MLRRLASILLLLCFVLPLSKCAAKQDPVGAPAKPDIVFSGYQMAQEWASEVGGGRWRSFGPLIAIVLVFALPIAVLWVFEPLRSTVLALGAIPALYTLQLWVFLFKPQLGGILAISCWVTLFILSVLTLLGQWRARQG